jgi:DNA end-binding protein Ku
MAARATGSATISFGLVSIPIKLYPTVDTTKTIRFNYLAKDGSRLKQQYIRASDGEIVPNDERVQGYEFAKGQYVLFDEDELKAMRVESTNSIEITEFIPMEQVERLYIERVYYVGPDKGAGRSYHLLRAAMGTTGRAALAKYAARGKSYLVMLRQMDDGIIMEQLKHQEELRPFDEVPLEDTEISDDELKLAITIIDQVSNEKFQPEKYTDEIREKMLELIQLKIDGQDISVPPEEKAETKIIDLMEALKASVATKSQAAAVAKPVRANRKASARKASRKS